MSDLLDQSHRARIARIIIGPRNPVPENSPHTLRALREARWACVSSQERSDALWAADAILTDDTLAEHHARLAITQATSLITAEAQHYSTLAANTPRRTMLREEFDSTSRILRDLAIKVSGIVPSTHLGSLHTRAADIPAPTQHGHPNDIAGVYNDPSEGAIPTTNEQRVARFLEILHRRPSSTVEA